MNLPIRAAAALALTLGLLVPVRAQITLGSGSGVAFNQVDYFFDTGSTVNSAVGQFDVDIPTVLSNVGASAGYLNVVTSDGWVVQNLPIDSTFDTTQLSTNFNLSSNPTPGKISGLGAEVQFSLSPLTSAPIGLGNPFAVGNVGFGASGFQQAGGPLNPLGPGILNLGFNLGKETSLVYQFGHANVQAAEDQCFPAAVANSLDWMRATYGLAVPDNNVVGLNGAPANSLVGKLDQTMARGIRSRADGDPVGAAAGLVGKLTYLNNVGLTNAVSVNHQGMLGGGNVTVGGLTSKGFGTRVNARDMINALRAGRDVELGFLFVGGGGHFVEVVGGGFVGGVPYILHKSDRLQTNVDPTDTAGTDRIDFSWLVDTDKDGDLNLIGGTAPANAAFLVTQGLAPEPSSLALAALGVGALGLVLRRRRHA